MKRQIYIVAVIPLVAACISSAANAVGDRGGITGSAVMTGSSNGPVQNWVPPLNGPNSFGPPVGGPAVKPINWFGPPVGGPAVKPINWFGPPVAGRGNGMIILPFPAFGAP